MLIPFTVFMMLAAGYVYFKEGLLTSLAMFCNVFIAGIVKLLIQVEPAPSFKVVDSPVVRRYNFPCEHGGSRAGRSIKEAAPRTQAILSDWNGIHIFRHEFMKVPREMTVGGVVFLASRHDSVTMSLGDPELKGVVGFNKPKRQGWN